VSSSCEDYYFSVLFGIGALSDPSGEQPIPTDTGVRVTTGIAPE
jgi:hypothetical protein